MVVHGGEAGGWRGRGVETLWSRKEGAMRAYH